MDSTMHPRLLRVHDLTRRALFFLCAGVCALQVSAQVRCTAVPDGVPTREASRVQATPHVGGDLLRYGHAGRSCEVQLDGHVTAWAVSTVGLPTVIAVATVSPAALIFFDTDLQLLQRLQLRDRSGGQSSPICALLVAPQRQSFVAIFSGMGELWELSYNPWAAEIGLGMVHDFQYREGHFVPGYLNPLRTVLPWNAAAARLDVDGHMVQLRKYQTTQADGVLVIHLDVRKPVPETVRHATPWQVCEKPGALQK